MKHVRNILLGFLLVLCSALPARAEYPSLIVYNGMGMGGLGRLEYVPDKGTYALLDGRFTPYVVDGAHIRPMRPDEGGGTMALPTALGSVDGAIVMLVPSYSALLKLNPDYTVGTVGSFGEFVYGGSMAKNMAVHKGHVFFFDRDTLLAYDGKLQKTGELKLENAPWNADDFIVAGDRLYFFEPLNTRPTDCGGMVPGPDQAQPVRDACGGTYDLLAIVDISDPAHMRVEKNEKLEDDKPPSGAMFRGVDPEHGTLLVVAGYGQNQTLQLRSFDKVNVVAAELKAPAEIVAMTDAAPFFAVLKTGDKFTLAPVNAADGTISVGEGLDLNLRDSGIKMKRHGEHLFVTAGSRLRVIEAGAAPRLVIARDFTGDQGDQLQVSDFSFGENLPAAAAKTDRARVEALLALKYLGPEKMLELQSELDKLTPDDAWAVPVLSGILKKEGQAMLLHPYCTKALGKIGPAAREAIPAILDASMQGAAILGDYTAPMIGALQAIDPEGDYIIPELPAFEKRHYESGAKYISKQILAALPGDKAKEALGKY